MRQLCLLIFAASTISAQTSELFEISVRPILMKSCVPCHGPAQQSSSLRLDSRDAMLKGGNRGPALIPGDPTASLLTKSIRHEDETLKMPVGNKRLKDSDIAAIEKWITLGAPWPVTDTTKTPITSGDPRYYPKLLREHWAFQPVADPRLPTVRNTTWSNQPIDRFILAALENKNLNPSQPADRPTLIRRLSYVLTGLPPTPLEVDLYVRDQSPTAYERVLDRLLKTPQFGEHWARHWMDIMRFAETFGNDWNYELLGASHYRDYLIRAFNKDLPYNDFIREHIAGDLLPKPRINTEEGINESEIGTTSFRLGELGHDDCIRFRQIRTDVVDNQIDTLGKAFQGLTIACARCHDHKLDPIPTADYYALYGVLTSSRMVTRTVDLDDTNAATKQRLAAMKPAIRTELARLWKQEANLIPRYLLAADRAWRNLPPISSDTAAETSLDRLQSLLSALETPKPKLEDPLYAWIHAAKSENSFATTWQTLNATYTKESQERAAFNSEHFRPFSGWTADGNATLSAPSNNGEFAIASTGPKAISGIFPAGLYTHTLSERLNAALRSPLVPKNKKFVSLLVMGGKLGARRTVLDNCMLGEDYKILDRDTLSWVKIPNRDDQPDLPYYLELATKADNTRIPDRPGHTKATPEQLAAPQSYFGFARAVLHDIDEPPRDELNQTTQLFTAAPPNSLEQLADRYAAIATHSITAWEQNRATAEDAAWLSWLIETKLLSTAASASPRLRAAIEDYRAIESQIAAPRVIQGLADIDPGYNFPVLIGGDATRPGKIAPRGFLSLINPGNKVAGYGSGRLEVAEMIAGPSNPLTARVMVNRIWQHLFGRGIVTTADNLGVYGEPPSHPELLDHLATNFIKNNWSIKALIRDIALSQTFRQSGTTASQSTTVDPLNTLLSQYPVRRMEAESIRDTLLAVSGRLDRTLYGPSIQPRRDEPSDYRKLHQGPLDGDGRRSIYIKVTRHEGSRFLETFDFPNPNIARGNRDLSNVPPQALALMNDPFVLDQAAVWAAKLIDQDAPSAEARIDLMFRTALGRFPNDAERARFTGLTKELASLHKVEPLKLLTSQPVWKDLAHAIFNLKELIYVR